jgi:hypothetical protein
VIMTKQLLPTIHLNATGRPELVSQLVKAYTQLDLALEKMAQAAPHGRDYYPQDKGEILGPTFLAAAEAHRVRMHKVKEVRDEIEQLAIAVHDQ